MGRQRILLAAAYFFTVCASASAVEGPTAAGPVGGADIGSALLPPPGLYGGTVLASAWTFDFLDGNGKRVPALRDAKLMKQVAGPFLYYVPDVTLLGGSIGIGGFVPLVNQCGNLFIGTRSQCEAGVGDPYVEVNWGRYFGTPRPSADAGAFPIPEGLAVLVGFGAVFPTGDYDPADPLGQALSPGNNIWDFAPSIAVTYTTTPILAEGTEFSAKLYWNNYLKNRETRYRTGDVLGLDFAISEHIGRFQIGVAGTYAFQVENDKLSGIPIPPDGLKAEILQLGGVVSYDMPEHASSLKIKANTSVFAENTVTFWGVTFGWMKKF